MSGQILVVGLLIESLRTLPLLAIVQLQLHSSLVHFLVLRMRRDYVPILHALVPVLDIWHQLLVFASIAALVRLISIVTKGMILGSTLD